MRLNGSSLDNVGGSLGAQLTSSVPGGPLLVLLTKHFCAVGNLSPGTHLKMDSFTNPTIIIALFKFK